MRKTIAVTLLAGAMVLSACFGAADEVDDHGDDHGDMATEVVVSMTEFSFSPSHIEVEIGSMVTFVVTNDGVAPHEFEVTTPEGREGHGHDDHGEASAEKLVLDPGETAEITVMFDGTQDEIACLIPGHYEAGMVLEVNQNL